MADRFGQQVEEQAKIVIDSGLGGAKREIERMCNHLSREVKSETLEFRREVGILWNMRHGVMKDTNTAQALGAFGAVANTVGASITAILFMEFVQVNWYHWVLLMMVIGLAGWIVYGIAKQPTRTVIREVKVQSVKRKMMKPSTKTTAKKSS